MFKVNTSFQPQSSKWVGSFRGENHNPLAVKVMELPPLLDKCALKWWVSNCGVALPKVKKLDPLLKCGNKKVYQSCFYQLCKWKFMPSIETHAPCFPEKKHVVMSLDSLQALPIQAGPTSNVACPPNLVEWVVPSPPCQM